MKQIPLTQGQVALVDDEDFAALSKFKWYALRSNQTFYACRKSVDPTGNRIVIRMHQSILPGQVEVDHIDGSGVNNQRYNLRGATRLQNNRAFKTKRAGCSSLFRGVSRVKNCDRWQAAIRVQYLRKHLGLFKLETDAARAYDAAAKLYFGDRTHLNFP